MRCLLIALATLSPVFAGTIAENYQSVGTSFQVQVTGPSGPLAGLRVTLERQGQGAANPLTAETDKAGIAAFRKLRPGDYLAIAGYRPAAAHAYLRVVPHRRSPVIRLNWPGTRVIAIRALTGTLRPNLPAGTTIELQEALSGRPLATGQLNSRGQFAFPAQPPGLYVLHLQGDRDLKGGITVRLGANAPFDHLDLDLAYGPGFAYLQRGECPAPDLHLHRLTGQVLDLGGYAVPTATVRLIDDSGNIVETLTPDDEGRIDSPRLLTGTYRLEIEARGFWPYRVILHAAPAATRPLQIRLGFMGMCSTASSQ